MSCLAHPLKSQNLLVCERRDQWKFSLFQLYLVLSDPFWASYIIPRTKVAKEGVRRFAKLSVSAGEFVLTVYAQKALDVS